MVRPLPRPPAAEGVSTRPPGSQPPLHVRPATPSPRSRAEGDAPDPTSPGSCAFPHARAAPAGPLGGSPRSPYPGSCLPSLRRLGLLPLSPAPPAQSWDLRAARSGGVAVCSPKPASLRFPAWSARPPPGRGPPHTPETARAQSAGARGAGRLGHRGAAAQPAGLGRDAGCAVSPGVKAMSGARCRTLYPFSGERHGQGLRFAAGELITLLQVPDGGWWEGEKEDGLRGWFPASYVQLLEVRGEGRELGDPRLRSLALLQTCCPHRGCPSHPSPNGALRAAAARRTRSSALLGAVKAEEAPQGMGSAGIAP